MENKFIENKIKSTFNSYQPELDNDAIWKDIEPHLTKKKDRKYFILWFFFFGLAIGLWFFYQGNQSILEMNNPKLAEKVEPVSPKDLAKSNVDKKESTPTILKKDLETSPIQNVSFVFTEKSTIKVKSTTVENSKFLPQDQNLYSEVKNSKVILPDWNTSIINTKSIPFRGLEMVAFNYLNQIDKDKITKERKNIKVKRKRIKPQRRNGWSVVVQSTIAPIFPIKLWNGKTSNSDAYLNRRKETESQLEAFGVNLNFQIQNKRGFVITTGLEYQQFNEKFEQKEISENIETISGIVGVVENGAGEIIRSINGPQVVTTTIEKRKRQFNNYRFLNMPIGIGRAWKKKKTFYKISGGIQYNLLFTFSGDILSPSNDVTFTGDFKSNIGLGIWFAGEYSRKINDRLKWVVAPKIQLPFNSITADNYELNQRYVPISLNVGVNYLLNPKKKKNQINRHKK